MTASIHMGAASGFAAGKAMAEYMLEQQVDEAAMRSAAYYGQTPGVEEAIAQGYGAAPQLRPDVDPVLAEALGLKPGQTIDADTLGNILSGHRADGGELPGQQTNQHRGEKAKGVAVAYMDLTLSAPKSFSIAWALSETEAERNSLLQAHRTAVEKTLRYIEQQAIRGVLGDGYEPGRMASITIQHYTARPTVETIKTDPATGEVYTELRSAKVAGDMQIHSHTLIPNLIRTESGRMVAFNTMPFHGRVKEFGAVYQALLACELTKINVAVDLDPRTNMARLPAIPEHAVDEFSKRSREGEAAAKAWAKREGIDWDELSPERQATARHMGAHAMRQDKETNTPDMQAWREQAERIGLKHDTVIGVVPERTRAERMDMADREGLPHLAEMLTKSAVLGQGDARVAIARGFIAAGGLENADDIGAMAKHWATAGVMQDGAETKLIWKDIGGKVRITTELHRDQEIELIALARSAAADRRLALTTQEVSAAVERSGVSFAGRGGNSQREAVETAGTDGGIAVVIGVAGSAKSYKVLKPLVEGWKQRGLEVWGTAQAWRQAKALRSSGIEHARTRALDPLLSGIADGRTKVGENSVVVVDEYARIGTRQLLELLRLREKHGFKLAMFGDDKQATAIEAGNVTDLLRRALGEERIPMLLETIRQDKEREQEIAGLWRDGKAAEAIKAKRADGTAELVPGGYREAVERVADLYVERRKATADRQDYRISISAPTNRDAHEIARLVRERRRDMGEVGPNLARIAVTDGDGNGRNLDLAAGDRVRLFARTRGVFMDENGRRKTAVVGDNGSVLEVLGVDRNNGMRVLAESGKESFVPWEALRDRSAGSKRPKLAYGDVMTIDISQGITSDEHIDASPAGTSAIESGKAYVKGSRHIVRHHLVGSMGAELREAEGRRMSGLPKMTPVESTEAAWANLTRNLARLSEKDSALAMLEKAAVASRRDNAKALQKALRRHEAREADGMSATTVRERQAADVVREAVPTLAEGVAAVADQQAAVSKAVSIVGSHAERPQPQPRMVKITEVEAQQQFADALRAHGFRLKGLPIMDGKLHYAPVDGNRGSEKSGAYKGFYGDDRPPAGAIYNYKQGGFAGTWKAHGETVAVSAAELAERAARAAEKAEAQRLERIAREAAGAQKAAAMIAGAWPAPKSHPYLVTKGVDPIGLYQDPEGNLLVPLRNADGELRNVQTIDPDGSKMYLYGAQKMGTFHMLGEPRPGEAVAIAEGYATAASVHRATGMPVAVALDTGNLATVALELRRLDPERPIWMAADNDHHLPLRDPPLANVGKEKAEAAASLVGGTVLLAPELPERAMVGKGTDWNDYAARRGMPAVKAAVDAQMGAVTPQASSRRQEAAAERQAVRGSQSM